MAKRGLLLGLAGWEGWGWPVGLLAHPQGAAISWLECLQANLTPQQHHPLWLPWGCLSCVKAVACCDDGVKGGGGGLVVSWLILMRHGVVVWRSGSSAWPRRGGSPRVSTAAPGGGSRAPPCCPTSDTVSERADGRTGEEWVRESGGCRVVDLEAVRRQKEEEQAGEEGRG